MDGGVGPRKPHHKKSADAHPRLADFPTIARWQLLAVPILGLAVIETARAFLHLDAQQPVSCCQSASFLSSPIVKPK